MLLNNYPYGPENKIPRAVRRLLFWVILIFEIQKPPE